MSEEQLEYEASARLHGAMMAKGIAGLEDEELARNLAFVATLGYAQRIRDLERCLSEHHAAGALEGMKIGDRCPICAELD